MSKKKVSIITVRFTAEDARQIGIMADRCGDNKGAWIRGVVLKELKAQGAKRGKQKIREYCVS